MRGHSDAANAATEALAAFLDYLRYERRLSARTLDGYRRDVDGFVGWLRDHGITDPRRVDSQHVRAYAASRFRHGLTAIEEIVEKCEMSARAVGVQKPLFHQGGPVFVKIGLKRRRRCSVRADV